MAGTTANRAFPYPTSGDAPTVHTNIQSLATSIDTDLTNNFALKASPIFTGTVTQPAVKYGYTTTVTSAGTLTLTVSSTFIQMLTGTTTHTVVMPVTSTLTTGHSYEIHNNSTGVVTVNSSGGNLIVSIPGGSSYSLTCIGTTLTTAADWDADWNGTTSVTGSGAVVLATSPTLVTPNIGTATGTSFNSITGLSSTTPVVDGTAAIGSLTTAARGDHVHPTDTSRAPLASPTFTGQVTVPAGTTGAAPIIFQSGSLLTAAAGGRMEYDGRVHYLTPSSTAVGGRGYAQSTHFYSLSTTRNLSDVNTVQSVFGVGFTAQATTTYEIEMMFGVSTTGATSNSLGISFGGTATLTSIGYQAQVSQNATSFVTGGTPTQYYIQTAANTTVTAAVATATYRTIFVKGLIRVNASGTIIPQLTFSAATGAVPVVATDSYVKLTPVGINTVTTVGAWA